MNEKKMKWDRKGNKKKAGLRFWNDGYERVNVVLKWNFQLKS